MPGRVAPTRITSHAFRAHRATRCTGYSDKATPNFAECILYFSTIDIRQNLWWLAGGSRQRRLTEALNYKGYPSIAVGRFDNQKSRVMVTVSP